MDLGKSESLHKSLRLTCLQQALRARRDDERQFVSGCVTVTKQWRGNYGGGVDDRETGTGLPSACWLSLAGRRKEKQKEKATQR